MSGKTVVLTGATGEIGGAIAAGLARSKQVAVLVLIVRDEAKGEAIAVKAIEDEAEWDEMMEASEKVRKT